MAEISTERARSITSTELARALHAAGVVDTLEGVRRIIIDTGYPDGGPGGGAVTVYVEKRGKTQLLDVFKTWDGIDVDWTAGTESAGEPFELEGIV